MPGIVCVGAATFDAIALVESYPRADERTVADQVVQSGGGPAATAAVACRRLGRDVQFVGAVGDDAEGAWARDLLVHEGVDVDGLRMVAGRPTGSTLILCERSSNTRAMATRPVPPVELDGEAASAVLAADWVHVDHVGWSAVASICATVAREDRPRISVDAGNPIDGVVLDDIDLYGPTCERLGIDLGVPNAEPADWESLLRRCPANSVVATRGADGAVGRDSDGGMFEVPGLAVEVVSTLGAGDVFHGALVAAVSTGATLAAASAYANVAAALSCRGVDGRTAIPTDEEVQQWLRRRSRC